MPSFNQGEYEVAMTPDFVAAVETHFTTNMGTSFPGVPLVYDNSVQPDTVEVYVSINVIAGDTFPCGIVEDSKSRNVGILQVEVFTQKDTGAGEARSKAYAIGKFFRRLNLSVTSEGFAVFKEPMVNSQGTVRGRHSHLVRIGYYYDFDSS